MKGWVKRVLLLTILIATCLNTFAQTKGPALFAGIGIGFDYGGLGGKLELLPEKHIGLFGGLGYDFLSSGWNVGAAYKILPGKKICPSIIAMYGYNGVFKGNDSYTARYNLTSHGPTFGVGIDVAAGIKGDKLSMTLTLPFRSQQFLDNYDVVKNDANVDIKQGLVPVGFSIGYNFLLTR